MDNQQLELRAAYYKALECYKRDDELSHDEGFYFLRTAAEGGVAEAMKYLGVLRLSGQYDPYPAMNTEEGVSWLKKAAAAGDSEAMYWLSRCYETGNGVPRNKREAKQWRKEALANGYIEKTPEEIAKEEQQLRERAEHQAKAVAAAEEAKKAAEEAAQQRRIEQEAKAEERRIEQEKKAEERKKEAEERAEKRKQEAEERAEARKEIPPILSVPVPAVNASFEIEPEGETVTEQAVEQRNSEIYAEDVAKMRAKEERDLESFTDRYETGMMIKSGGAVFLFCLAVVLLLYLIFKEVLDTQAKTLIFWAAGLIVILIFTAIGCIRGSHGSTSRVDREEEYRDTSFFQNFMVNLQDVDNEKENPQIAWKYRIFRSLDRTYLPVTTREVPDLSQIREYSGLMYAGLEFGTAPNLKKPDFLIVTDRAAYCIMGAYVKGSLSGSYQDAQWTLKSADETKARGKGADEAKKMDNLILKNQEALNAAKRTLQEYAGISLEGIPFYNLIVLNPEADITAVRFLGAGENTRMIQGPPDKVRTVISVFERDLHTHEIRLDDIAKAAGRAGEEMLHRQASEL